jgi:SAM-dependent methyltransferase
MNTECAVDNEWFKRWFDTRYYHILYAHRSWEEAALFINNLVGFLQPPAGSRVLDLACGKGRHSAELSKFNLDVTGVDLSPCSIAEAKKLEHQNLKFEVQDMRLLHFERPFNCIFNLFTSFGYFECDRENAKVLAQVYLNLEPNGYFVLDYFNAELIDPSAVHEQTIERDGIRFLIKKWVEKGIVFKEIRVIDGQKEEVFYEKVQLLTFDAIATLLREAGFSIFARFGNYQLEEWRPNDSTRCIIIAQKPDMQ